MGALNRVCVSMCVGVYVCVCVCFWNSFSNSNAKSRFVYELDISYTTIPLLLNLCRSCLPCLS
jgi:hypothetical protein